MELEKKQTKHNNKLKKIKWKVFFYLILVSNIFSISLIVGYLGVDNINKFFLLMLVIDLITTSVLLISLYAFCWHKKIVNQKFWKIIFILFLIIEFIGLFINQDLSNKELSKISVDMASASNPIVDIVVYMIFAVPMFIALYLYVFKSPNIWKVEENKQEKQELS
ncbi:hypothetical protein ISS03_05475 [Patescibacteria group bacterium]|nr:hypothetical protein [Patescibacteria group bacterium]